MSETAHGEPDDKFVKKINLLMAWGLVNKADPDVMAKVCLSTAHELYEYYGAGAEYTNYLSFVTDAQFEKEEVDKMFEEAEEQAGTDDSD